MKCGSNLLMHAIFRFDEKGFAESTSISLPMMYVKYCHKDANAMLVGKCSLGE